MKEYRDAARVRGTGGKEKNAADSLRSHPHYTPKTRRVQGPAHGRVVGTVWRKRVRKSAHMLCRHPAMPFTVLSGDTKAGPLKLGNRSASRSALLAFYVELQRIAQERRRHLLKPQRNGGEGETT